MRREARSSPDGVRDAGMSPRFSTVLGQSVTLEDAVPATVDAVESWLFDSEGAPTGRGAVENADETAARALGRYVVQRGLHALWQQALWEGWSLHPVDDHRFWAPDSPPFALLFDAWWQRLRANFAQWVSLAQNDWISAPKERRRALGLARSVIGVERPRGRRRRLVFGRPDVKALPVPPGKGGAEPIVPDGFPCPPASEATRDRVHAALEGVARAGGPRGHPAAELKRNSFATTSSVEGWALAVDVADVIDAMRHCLDCPKEQAESLVSFLPIPDARKLRQFGATGWWRTQSSRTSLRRPKFSDHANPFADHVFLGGPKRRLFALFIALEHSSLQCVSRS